MSLAKMDIYMSFVEVKIEVNNGGFACQEDLRTFGHSVK